jgi:hypothetical protein
MRSTPKGPLADSIALYLAHKVFFRYLYRVGLMACDLAKAIESPRRYRLSNLPPQGGEHEKESHPFPNVLRSSQSDRCAMPQLHRCAYRQANPDGYRYSRYDLASRSVPSLATKRVSPHAIRHYAGFRTIPGEASSGCRSARQWRGPAHSVVPSPGIVRNPA